MPFIDPLKPPPRREQGADWGEHGQWFWQGLSVHWRVLGETHHPPVVLVHGFGAGSGHWRRNASLLARSGWCVYALDLIGFGASSQPGPHPLQRLDNRLWARQLQAFLEQVVQGPAVLVGHSLGGLVSLTCSVYFPTWVKAVVAAPLPDPTLLSASTGSALQAPRRSRWRRDLHRLLVVILCRILPLELIVPLLAHSPLLDLGIQAAYHQPVIGDGELHRIIARPARRPSAVRALRAMSIGMALRPHGATAGALLRRLKHPMLLIWGRQDRLVPLEVSRLCHQLRPDLPLEVLQGTGHCPHDEAPEDFIDCIRRWLEPLLEHQAQGEDPTLSVGGVLLPRNSPIP